MTFEEKLAQALSETAEERKEQMLDAPKKHKFSLAFKLWESDRLKNLRGKDGGKLWTFRRSRYALTAMAAALSLALGAAVYAAVSPIGRYSFDAYTEYSKLLIEKVTSDKETIEIYYGLPQDNEWEICDYYSDDTSSMIVYKCGEKKVTLGQEIITSGSMSNINTENAVIEPVSLYEKDDGFLVMRNNGICMIFWIYDGYLFEMQGKITKNEAIDLARSIKNMDWDKFS